MANVSGCRMRALRFAVVHTCRCVVVATVLATVGQPLAAQEIVRSHPPLRPLPELTKRPLPDGPKRFVDAKKGDDAANGAEATPWKTIAYALTQTSPGDTLVLRGGAYRENVVCSVSGRPDAPIVIRSYPGERVFLDGGMAEFFETPETAWEPNPDGPADEYRSVKVYKNIRDVLGYFGDSQVALTTYWHTMDLRATNEFWTADPDKKLMVLPVYCGPGLWYDRESGRIHVRLAHTHLKTPGLANYAGETDPRKLPLVISPFRSVPLRVEMARHVKFQDLVVRGGGFDSVVLNVGIDVELDNVAIYAGTYGMRVRSTGPFRMVNSAIHGSIQPWAWRDENGLYTYTPKSYDPFLPPPTPANERNIARLNTHALLVTEGWYEFEVFAYPFNHDWEIANCEFTDGHDGVYLSGKTIRFHHNVVERIQDDGLYLSSPQVGTTDDIHVHHNLVRDTFSCFACNSTGGPSGNIYLYRNVLDQRQGTPFTRPSKEKPEGVMPHGHGFLVHGGNLLGIESLHFYQNTFVTENLSGSYAARTWTQTHPKTVRRVLNNIFVYFNSYPGSAYPEPHDLLMDGNLHWCPASDAKLPPDFFTMVRGMPGSKRMAEKYPGGWEPNSFVAPPGFVAFEAGPAALNDYRLKPDSAAVGKGVALPADLPDPQRPAGDARPDVGAFPLGSEFPGYGRQFRWKLPLAGRATD